VNTLPFVGQAHVAVSLPAPASFRHLSRRLWWTP